ncbi:MAG TPA: hypothetical protein VGY32_13335 [Solirubrobacteraceae bacterium]|nr:hypothetical protein [Solirubrobacteraceae bacterium]
MSRRQSITAALLTLAALAAVVVIGGVRNSRPEVPGANGWVYIETNSAAPNSNEVLAFRYRDGELSAQGVRRYPTHGSGSHDLNNAGVLDADQELIVNPQRTLLFAVNSNSDTIAVFHIRPDGSLTPVSGSPFPSYGRAPTSLGLAGRALLVANKAQDGVRDLRRVPASYASLPVRHDGSLGPPISLITVPPHSSPLQAYVTPDQKVMIASEESGVFRAFVIGRSGTLTQGANSPLRLDPAVNPDHIRFQFWPAGLESHPTQKILYAQVANLSRTIVYSWDDRARLQFVRSLPNPGSFLPCWTHVNSAGTRMYSGNAGSDNLSVFDISGDPTDPRWMQTAPLNSPGNPWNFEIDPTGRVMFMLDMRAVRQIPPQLGNDLHSLRISSDGRLHELRASPVKIPVAPGTNPVGLAVVPSSG